MRKLEPAVYQTVAEFDRSIRAREADAAQLEPGPARQSILREIARLRAYSDTKRWLEAGPAKAEK